MRRGVDRARLARLGILRRALPSELLSGADRARIARVVWGSPPAPAPEPTPERSPGHSLSDATVRATLCAITRPDRYVTLLLHSMIQTIEIQNYVNVSTHPKTFHSYKFLTEHFFFF